MPEIEIENPKYFPKEITRLYVSKNQTEKINLTENFVMFYLGQHGIFVSAIKPITVNSWLLTVKYNEDKDIDALLFATESPFAIKRVFKSGFYNKDKFYEECKSTVGKIITNLFGLVNGKKAIIGINVQSGSHRDDELKKLFVDFSLKVLESAENKFDCDIDPKKATIWLNVQKVEVGDKSGMITWLDDPNKLLRT